MEIRPIDIYNARKVFKMSQKDFAKKLGVAPPSVSHWENGTNGVSESVKDRVLSVIEEANAVAGKGGIFPSDEEPKCADYDAMLAYKEARKQQHEAEKQAKEKAEAKTPADVQKDLHRFMEELEFMVCGCAEGLVDPKFLKRWFDQYKGR